MVDWPLQCCQLTGSKQRHQSGVWRRYSFSRVGVLQATPTKHLASSSVHSVTQRVDCRFLLVPFPSVKGKHLRHTSYNWWSLLSGFILSIIKKMCCPIRRNQCPLYCKQHVVWYICLITQILTAGNLVLKQPSPVCLFFSVILLKPDNLVCLCIFFISFFGDFPLY